MAIGTIRLTLDTFSYNHISDIVVVRGDYEARFIEAFIAAKGVTIPVSSTAAVMINARRPDEKSKSFYGSANEDGSVSVPLTQWMSDIVGRVECSISVVDNGKKISTTHFYIQVQEPPYDGSEISEDDPHKDIVTETYELLLKVEAGELKDAYGYAQESGYKGSKEEFARDINPDNITAEAEQARDEALESANAAEKARNEALESTNAAEQARDEALESAAKAEDMRNKTNSDALAVEETYQNILRNVSSVQLLNGTDITVSLNNNIEYRANGVTNLNIRKFNPRCIIYDAEDIVANDRVVTYMDGLGGSNYVNSSGIVDDCVRFVAKTTGGTSTSTDRAIIKTDNVILKNYPFVRVAYKTNIAASELNVNMVTENGHYDSSERKLFFKQRRYADEKIQVGVATYNGLCDKAIDSVYAECAAIYIPIWSTSGLKRQPDHYFDIQYIGFFESLEDANNFDFDVYSSDEDKSPFPEKMGLYSIQFSTGDNISVLLPASVSWIINEPTFEPNKTYWLDFYSTTDGGFVGYDKLYAIENAAKRIEDANGHPPYIDSSSGHWYVWDVETGGYKDSGVEARGEQGRQGEQGKQGEPGAQGEPGTSGLPTIYNCNSNGWEANLPAYTETRIMQESSYINILGFDYNTENVGNDMWAITFTLVNNSEGYAPNVCIPASVEWAVAEPIFTSGYTYYLSFIPFGNKLLGVWVVKELKVSE